MPSSFWLTRPSISSAKLASVGRAFFTKYDFSLARSDLLSSMAAPSGHGEIELDLHVVDAAEAVDAVVRPGGDVELVVRPGDQHAVAPPRARAVGVLAG